MDKKKIEVNLLLLLILLAIARKLLCPELSALQSILVALCVYVIASAFNLASEKDK